jgi:hypothetical protein
MSFTESADFVSQCRRIKESHFTRARKLPLHDLLLSILHRKGTTLAIELRGFFTLIGRSGTISKPGYLKQRMKLNPEAIKSLCDFHTSSLYREEEMNTLGGYLVVAADGSNVNVPTTPETLSVYGTSSRKGTKPQAALGLSCLYDLLNKVILDVTTNRVKFDERTQAHGHMERLARVVPGMKVIVVLDRNYTGAYEFIRWGKSGQRYVIRLKDNDYKKERKAMVSDDEVVDIVLDDTRTNPFRGTDAWAALKETGSVRVRVVNIRLGHGAVVSLATNLPGAEFDAQALGKIYAMRWGVETVFDMLKNNLQLENFTGTKTVLIEQDIYACVYLCNLAQDMIADAELENAISGKPTGKHKMAVNKTYAVGVLKEDFVKALLEPDFDKRRQIFNRMIAEIKEHVLPVRPDRHYERNKNLSHVKYPTTHKRSF